jgi:hypothetical protein
MAVTSSICPDRAETETGPEKHAWSLTQKQQWNGSNYVRETGIMCLYCSEEYVEPEGDVVAYFLKRRASATRRASSNG